MADTHDDAVFALNTHLTKRTMLSDESVYAICLLARELLDEKAQRAEKGQKQEQEKQPECPFCEGTGSAKPSFR